MGTVFRVGAIVLGVLVSFAAGWSLHRLGPFSVPASAAQSSESIRIPAVDATPQYLAQMAHHFGSPPANELQRLKKAALGGSDEAVDKLVLSYMDCASMEAYMASRLPLHQQRPVPVCDRQVTYWIRVARENESQSGANLAFNELRDSSRCEDVYRARFWLDKMLAVTPGTPWKEASEELKRQERRCG